MPNASTPPEISEVGVKPGDLLAGKYRIDRVLGRGGMGMVVAAHHVQLEDHVALKFLLPQALVLPEAVARFAREARAAVKIKSEHVARVTDVGQLENGAPYMVMEYLEGGDLGQMLAGRGPLPAEQVVDFVLQAGEAIAEAHSLGIVHRDLKPSNLFCVRGADGRLSIKVLDFGISKVTTPGSSQNHDITRTTAMMGSPMYMSPEQMQSSKSVDARADIWSIGAIAFELIAGRAPFQGDTIMDLAIKVVNKPAPTLTELVPTVPPGLAQVVARCLEKERERRFPSMAELALALEPFGSRRARISVERILDTLRAAGLSERVLPSQPASLPERAGQETVGSWGHAGAAPRARDSVLVIGAVSAAAATLAALGVGAFFMLRSPSAHRNAATPPAISAPDPSSLAVGATSSTSASPSSLVPPDLAPTSEDVPVTGPGEESAASASTASSQPRPPHPVHSAGPRGKPPPKANCNPPYTVDPSTGEHRYKPECL